ncbi:MAG: hypothetical protein ACR2JR_05400 [Rubrobacteraceae bacterium]
MEGVVTAVAKAAQAIVESSEKAAAKIIERVGDLVRALGNLLGGAMPDSTDGGIGRAIALSSQRVAELAERIGDIVGNVAQALGDLFGGVAQSPTEGPSAPPYAPPAVPTPALPISPGGSSPTSNLSFGSSISSDGASAPLLLATLILFSATAFQVGRLSWPHREPLRLRSALRLAVERPG